MHKYIEQIKTNNNLTNSDDKVRFNIVLGPILNFFGKFFFPNFPEYGNCSRWTSAILYRGGLTTGIFVWPNTVFINMFENYSRTEIKKTTNMNVIYYEQPEHVEKLSYGVKDKPIWFEKSVAPFQSIRNYFYGDLKHFAKIIVSIPKNQTTAIIKIIPDTQVSKPNELRNILNSKYFIFTSVFASVIIYKKGFGMAKTIYKNIRNSK